MFWKKNTQAFLKHHPHHELILKRLKNIGEPESLEPFETTAGDIGLVYKGIPLHAPTGAMQEAELEVQKNCRPALDRVHLLIGLGLGYLLEAAFKASPGQIVVYEPNLELLKFVLENVDLSDYLGIRRVRFATNIKELLDILNPLLITFEPIDFLSSGGYALLLNSEMGPLMAALGALVDDRKRDYRTARYFHNQWIKQFFENLPHVATCFEMPNLQGKAKGKPAIVISRGPSLDAALPAIKAMENQAVLVAVGGALHHLYKAGITPDFATFLDSRGMKEQLHGLPDSYLEQIVFLNSQFTQPDCYTQPSSAVVRYTLQGDRPYAHWLSKIEPRIQQYFLLDGCGTVSHIALQTAMIMGCNPVVLIGQDLAFPNNLVYAGGEELKTNGKGIMTLEKRADLFTGPSSMARVEGQNGEMLESLASFKGFIRYFEKTAQANASKTHPTTLYNASIGGAKIDGYTLKPMQEFVGEWTDWKTPNWLSQSLNHAPTHEMKTLEKLQTKLRVLSAEMQAGMNLLEQLIAEGKADPDSIKPDNEQWTIYLAKHFLISNFLVLDMIDFRQKYDPTATTPEAIEKNRMLILDGYQQLHTLLKDNILPWVTTCESQILARLYPEIQPVTCTP